MLLREQIVVMFLSTEHTLMAVDERGCLSYFKYLSATSYKPHEVRVFTMLSDEREESLREVASLGNIKAVKHFLVGGVNVNAQNRMNGWTALHWAAHRNHADIVRLLLANGADPHIKNAKDQSAIQIGERHVEIRDILLPLYNEDKQGDNGPAFDPSLPIEPAYLKNPDLEKTWLHPDEFSDNKLEHVVRRQLAQATIMEGDKVELPEKKEEGGKEILVYNSSRSEASILGSVYLPDESMEKAILRIREELDLPSQCTFARHNGKITIPINQKQMEKKLLHLFRSDDDVLIVIPNE